MQHVVDWLAAQEPEPEERTGIDVHVKPTKRGMLRRASIGARALFFCNVSQHLGVKLLEHVGGDELRSTRGEAVAATAAERTATIVVNCILMSLGDLEDRI